MRPTAMILAFFACVGGGILPASAASPAETFVSANIDKGLTILNDKQLSQAQRREQFSALLLRVTDMRRIAMFTLGREPEQGKHPRVDFTRRPDREPV